MSLKINDLKSQMKTDFLGYVEFNLQRSLVMCREYWSLFETYLPLNKGACFVKQSKTKRKIIKLSES